MVFLKHGFMYTADKTYISFKSLLNDKGTLRHYKTTYKVTKECENLRLHKQMDSIKT